MNMDGLRKLQVCIGKRRNENQTVEHVKDASMKHF